MRIRSGTLAATLTAAAVLTTAALPEQSVGQLSVPPIPQPLMRPWGPLMPFSVMSSNSPPSLESISSGNSASSSPLARPSAASASTVCIPTNGSCDIQVKLDPKNKSETHHLTLHLVW